MRKVFETFNRLILVQFIQSHDVLSSNLFDENSNQFDFIIDSIEEIQKETQIPDAIIIIFKDV